MGKTVYGEESSLTYLKNLSKSNFCSTGLILGQATELRDYAILMVRTPEQSNANIAVPAASPAQFQNVNEIKENWIADHSKHVIKMLPGGMWVLGVFICSPNNIFLENSAMSKAKTILTLLHKQLSNEPLLNANSPSSEKLLLHFNTENFQYECKVYDINAASSNFKPVNFIFQNKCTKWCKIYCNFNLSLPSFGGNMFCHVKDQLEVALKEVDKNLEKAMVLFNGKIKNSNEILEETLKKENLSNSTNFPNKIPSLKADIYMPFKKNEDFKDIIMKDCDAELHLLGVLASQVFLSEKTTVAEAINAVKQDIVRSLTARFEMHWDSLVEEEYGSPEETSSIHEPPRRVSISLPGGVIELNDYLFPGEGALEVVSSFKEMLDLDIDETNLEKEIETQGDPMEFYEKSTSTLAINSSDKVFGSVHPKGLIIFLFSIVVILIAIAIALLIQRSGNVKGNK